MSQNHQLGVSIFILFNHHHHHHHQHCVVYILPFFSFFSEFSHTHALLFFYIRIWPSSDIYIYASVSQKRLSPLSVLLSLFIVIFSMANLVP